MSTELDTARKLLTTQDCTCVLIHGETVHTSTQRGVKPLLALLDAGVDVRNFSAADKVVGKAAAFLYCLLGIRELYAPVITTAAAQILEQHGIRAVWDEQVDFIWNRHKTGMCPMETAVRDIREPDAALAAMREALRNMK